MKFVPSVVSRACSFAAVLVFVTVSAPVVPEPASAGVIVKLSGSGICHDADSPWYSRTKNFTPHETLEACLKVGRLPKGASTGGSGEDRVTRLGLGTKYRREAFGAGWADEDGDCADTRAEMLESLSTTAVIRDGCRVIRGRWIDPYTGQVFLDAGDLDIDHIVPLAWAWERGASSWSADRRADFANDPVNLLPVKASANRSKGADGPDEWLPPNAGYHCQYVLRFTRIAAGYGLLGSEADQGRLARVRAEVCG